MRKPSIINEQGWNLLHISYKETSVYFSTSSVYKVGAKYKVLSTSKVVQLGKRCYIYLKYCNHF
jgi:hypothetical protein